MVTQFNINQSTPMGATLNGNGATFKVWAPNAHAVHVIGDFNDRVIDKNSLLIKDEKGYWTGYVEGVQNRHKYIYYVRGDGGSGRKRDPFARELEQPFPAECIVRTSDYPWHKSKYKTPKFQDFLIYQLHIGTFNIPNFPTTGGTFLDVAMKLPYLVDLGITAIQLLPIQEFHTMFSKGYNGVDYFSPEMGYAVQGEQLDNYLTEINALLALKGYDQVTKADLTGEMNQMKALVDLAHIYGIAVILDVVYNHAGGDWGYDEGMYFFDFQRGDNGKSLYFKNIGHAGGLVFDFSKPEVRDFLIQNGKFLLDEYRVDGLRYDQVSVIDSDGRPHGWQFCQDLMSTLRFHRPDSLHIAEYWQVNPWVVKSRSEGGAGFCSTLTDGLRRAIRTVISQASYPNESPLSMTDLGRAMWPEGFHHHWQYVQGPENHDIVYREREVRISKLGDYNNPRSWYGRSRARVGTGIGLVAPGIPMLFMGQEFLEDKQWADDFNNHGALLLHWKGVDTDKQMIDHLRFVRELIQLRWKYPALRGNGFQIIYSHDQDRVLAFQRWDAESGNVVVCVIHLSTYTKYNYRIGFPSKGVWKEVLNSDLYENWVNPSCHGNGGAVHTDNMPMHGYPCSTNLVLPANSIILFTT